MKTKDLISHLNMESGLFRDLIALLHRETECMVARDYKGLYETIGLKDQLAMRINGATGERQKFIKEAFASLGGNPDGEATLSAVIESGGPHTAALEEARKTILSLGSTVQEINRLNSRIVESSLGNVVKTLGFLGNFMQPSTYKATGSFEGFAVKGTRLSEGA